MTALHFLIHILGVDYGLAYGTWSWYNFWSGVGGSFLCSMIAVGVAYYIHHTCQSSWRCLRWGSFPTADGKFRLCRKHHPDHRGRSRLEMIHELHWKLVNDEV